jgi:hypothetical protein
MKARVPLTHNVRPLESEILAGLQSALLRGSSYHSPRFEGESNVAETLRPLAWERAGDYHGVAATKVSHSGSEAAASGADEF